MPKIALLGSLNTYLYGFLLQVAIFLIQRNRHALLGRAIDEHDMEKVMQFLKNDPVVVYYTSATPSAFPVCTQHHDH